MKIVVVGGAGVFGSRLAVMLLRDGHDVVLAGRQRPDAVATEMGATAIALDRRGDLAPLWAQEPDVVVDAAGPFHSYGDDPYRLARAAIARGVHYLDLADDAAFCAGITALDAQAKAAGVIALSGASSVPALSSAIAADLAAHADEVDTVTSVILPGNRAPRGRAVIDSILHQTGTDIVVTLDGAATQLRSWSAPRRFDLGQGDTRWAYAIRVPDQTLLPAFLGARSVTFYAGLELGVMARGLAIWSWLRGTFGLGNPAWLRGLVHRGAKLLERFGTDVGAMQVCTVARTGERWQRRTWQVVVRSGDGPSVPGVAVRAILRTLADQPSGAGPALARFDRATAEAAMEGLDVTFTLQDVDIKTLFERVLGDQFARLALVVQASHATYGPRRWTGHASVTRGTGLFARLIAALFRFPKATPSIPVTVLKTPHDGGEVWERNFDGQVFRSVLSPGPSGMSERFGPFTFDLNLHESEGALHFPVKAGRLGWLPLPRVLLPKSVAREYPQGGNFCFDVALYAPLTGQMIVHYQGTLARDAAGQGVKET